MRSSSPRSAATFLRSLRSESRPCFVRSSECAPCLPRGLFLCRNCRLSSRTPGALETIAHYLELLEEAFLVVPLRKHAARAARRRASPPKLVTLSNALLAVVDPSGSPDAEEDSERFGAWVENACLAHAWNSGQSVSYWREEPFEVDAVIEGSWGAWAVEVKTGSVSTADLRGLGEFTKRFPKYRPLVLCDAQSAVNVGRAGFAAMLWQDFLLKGPVP